MFIQENPTEILPASPAVNRSGRNEVCSSGAGLVVVDEKQGAFFLHSGGATYAVAVSDHGFLHHGYWGPPLAAQDLASVFPVRGRAFSPNPIPGDGNFSLDTVPLEYPAYGRSDYGLPAIEILHPPTGSRILDLRYDGHRVLKGKPSLEDLPACRVSAPAEAETLVITLRDSAVRAAVELSYTAFAGHPVMARSARILNEGDSSLVLRRALSCSIDFSPQFSGFHFVHLHGAWARETQIASHRLHPGLQSLESRRGASSHAHNPFFALTEMGAHEEYGAAYGFSLVYSGNFLAAAEVGPYGRVRAQIGLNPFDFSWTLDPGEAFQTPEAVLAFSREGLGGLSRAFHRVFRRHLIPEPWRDRERPVLLNNWEATYFDFDADRIESLAKEAAGLGVELFVLDDGWFGRREDETSSLGDWTANPRKLPRGLADLVRRVRQHGIEFGLWMEPEMVSPDSDLYRAHPDWCLHVPTHSRSLGRNQLVLDLSRPEVRKALFERISEVLRSAPISYVKWDMNRNMTEIGSAAGGPERQQETAHRYMLGLYALLKELMEEFPEILFEGCSGGGGRFDPGMLHYMPQIWTSDNSDAVARLQIQYGASVVYPFSALSAHVSTVPNHQVGRYTPLKTRGDVAFTGSFGYELDTSTMTEEQRKQTRSQIIRYKNLRRLLITGDLFRLRSPFEGNEAAWIVVSPDRREALATHVNVLAEANPSPIKLRLRGLKSDGAYRVNGKEILQGDFLMQAGISVPEPTGDFISNQWHLHLI